MSLAGINASATDVTVTAMVALLTTPLAPLNARSNSSGPSPSDQSYSTLAYVTMVTMGCLLVCGMVGNAIVIYVFHKNHRKRMSTWSTTDMLIVYLAYIDFILSIFNPMLYIYQEVFHYEWHLGYVGCKTIPVISAVSSNMSAAMILIIAVDRYRVIIQPFKGHYSKRRIRTACLLALVLSFLTYYHRIYHETLYQSNEVFYCNIKDVEIISFLIPEVLFLVLRDVIFLTVFIFTTLSIRRSLTKSCLRFKNCLSASQRHEKTKKTIRLLTTLGVVFTLLVFPREMLHLTFSASWLGGSTTGIPISVAVVRANAICKALQVSNSCVNVFIYAHLHLPFRKTSRNGIRSILHLFSLSSNESSRSRNESQSISNEEKMLMNTLQCKE